MEVSKKAWKYMVRLKQRCVQVRRGDTCAMEEFEKVQYYGHYLRRPEDKIKNFHVGGLKVDERLLVMIVTTIMVPHGSNHSTLNGVDLIIMYCIQNDIQ